MSWASVLCFMHWLGHSRMHKVSACALWFKQANMIRTRQLIVFMFVVILICLFLSIFLIFSIYGFKIRKSLRRGDFISLPGIFLFNKGLFVVVFDGLMWVSFWMILFITCVSIFRTSRLPVFIVYL